ncbi:histidinol-phosphate aminotransferase [Neisseria gonorrhoeae]|uniref:Histidinol-phosphate aminotransferase n=1 Tax=Neisseria gonorrhoeae TaxID=485 RepID=A0A378VUI3_NEIGO|nr:histidinol-phosphate aminotransferase [Neisseria gonorrhoeae]
MKSVRSFIRNDILAMSAYKITDVPPGLPNSMRWKAPPILLRGTKP